MSLELKSGRQNVDRTMDPLVHGSESGIGRDSCSRNILGFGEGHTILDFLKCTQSESFRQANDPRNVGPLADTFPTIYISFDPQELFPNFSRKT